MLIVPVVSIKICRYFCVNLFLFCFYLFLFTVRLIKDRMETVIWGNEEFKAEQGKHWDITFIPVIGSPKKKVSIYHLIVCMR